MSWLKRLQGVKSLFDSNQQRYCDTLIPTMYAKGYKHYVAYTNNDYSGYYSTEPDLFIVFSKDKIQPNGAYSYNIPQNSVRCSIRSYDYSSSSSAVNSDRVKTEAFSGRLKIDLYEHIYSNAEYSGTTIQPDILAPKEVKQYDSTQALGVVLLAFLLFYVFWQMCTFRR